MVSILNFFIYHEISPKENLVKTKRTIESSSKEVDQALITMAFSTFFDIRSGLFIN